MSVSLPLSGTKRAAQPRFTEATPTLALLLLAGMVLLWTLTTALSHSAPDVDGIEELVWAASLELGYTKHPPLPSWVMYFLTQAFGTHIWLIFLAGQLACALTLWIIWRLGCEFTTPERSLVATVLLSTCIYFSMRGTIYNHNTMQLWSIAGCTWLFYRALHGHRPWAWVGVGILGGLAMLTKYSALVQFAAFFVFMLRQRSFADSRHLRGVALATLAFLVTVSPHLVWLVGNDFAPLKYADRSMEEMTHLEAFWSTLSFLENQAARLSPMIAVLLGLAWWNRKSPIADGVPYARDLSPWDKSFLLWVGLFPLVSTVLISFLMATRLATSWATTFFILFGFYAFWRLSGDARVLLRRTILLAIAIHVLLAVGYSIARGPLAYYSGKATRSTYPGAEVSAQMQQLWRTHVPGLPLRLVAADTWLGGNIAIHTGPEVRVLIDGDYAKSPWLDPDAALLCGALVAYSTEPRGQVQPPLLALYERTAIRGMTEIPWSSKRSPMIEIHWGILPPSDGCPLARR